MHNERVTNEVLAQYWLKYYAKGNCVLCDNTGRIEGEIVGQNSTLKRVNTYCFCPNGRAIRAGEEK